MSAKRVLGSVVIAVVLVGAGILIGIAVKPEGDDHTAQEQLQASSIGNISAGRELFVENGCANCHAYAGKGGTDAPPLDFMKGQLSANSVANMSGRIWNHVPQMKEFFEEENIPFPTFEGDQMADLVAYLHGGGPPPDVKAMDGMHEDEEGSKKHEEDEGGSKMHDEKEEKESK